MKILVVSDSHRDDEILKDLVKEVKDIDVYIHCGDSCSDIYNLYPFDSVLGNCDYFPFDEKRLLRTEAGNILVRHMPFIRPDERKDVRVFIHGHTHRYMVKEEDGLLIINPGSISHPRDDSHGSYAVLTIEGTSICVDVIDVFTKNVLIHYQIM